MRCRLMPAGSAAGALGAALFLGALGAPPAHAHSAPPPPPDMLLVLPWSSVPSVRALNPDTDPLVLRQSQIPVAGSASPVQAAVVDLLPPDNSPGSLPLFLFPQDVPVVQQWNQGMTITPVRSLQTPLGDSGATVPVEEVRVSETAQSPAANAPAEFVFICPASDLPTMPPMNPGMQFDLHCLTQVQAGSFDLPTQTALVGISPAQGSYNPDQPLSLYVPAAELPMLQQLNIGATFNVVQLSPTGSGKTGQISPTDQAGQMALVNLMPDRRMIDQWNQN